MARAEKNNPTVRMGAVLDDFDALDYAYDQLAIAFAGANPEAFETQPAKPSAEAVASERTRRQLTLGKVDYKRAYMRRQRAQEPEGSVKRPLTAEEEAAILAEVEKEFL